MSSCLACWSLCKEVMHTRINDLFFSLVMWSKSPASAGTLESVQADIFVDIIE